MSAENTKWKEKFSTILNTCQEELKKTTEIGKKMLSASKTNTSLKDTYEELGHLVVKSIRNNELDWSNARVHQLIAKIEECEAKLESIEEDVKNIKCQENEPGNRPEA
jgi:hypothetical protein